MASLEASLGAVRQSRPCGLLLREMHCPGLLVSLPTCHSQTRNGKRSLGASQMGRDGWESWDPWMPATSPPPGPLVVQCSTAVGAGTHKVRAGSPANGLARVDNCQARSLQQRLAPLTDSPGGPASAAPQWTSCYLRC